MRVRDLLAWVCGWRSAAAPPPLDLPVAVTRALDLYVAVTRQALDLPVAVTRVLDFTVQRKP